MMGVMGQSGMSTAMANTLVNLIPTAMTKFIAPIIGVFTIPLSLLFDADSYYYGIMPVIMETTEALGGDALDIVYASMIGQSTTGFPITPMNGTFFLMTGLLELDIGDYQKALIPKFVLVTVLMTIFACATGLFTF